MIFGLLEVFGIKFEEFFRMSVKQLNVIIDETTQKTGKKVKQDLLSDLKRELGIKGNPRERHN